jgi:hypothetical protein
MTREETGDVVVTAPAALEMTDGILAITAGVPHEPRKITTG